MELFLVVEHPRLSTPDTRLAYTITTYKCFCLSSRSLLCMLSGQTYAKKLVLPNFRNSKEVSRPSKDAKSDIGRVTFLF